MNIKNNFLSRMTRRKNSTPAEPEEGAYEIPPPSAIGRMPSDSSRRAESMESGYGLDLELLASDKPPRPDSANGMNAQESGHAPALESSPQPISDESPDAPKPPRALEMHQEYGLELEVLAASESDESPDAPEPLEEHEEAGSSVAEIVAKASLEQPDEATETPLAEDRFYPLVRDARGNWRPGKGFSRSELREAGLNLTDAARLRIRVDKRRRNAHPMNVGTLEKAKNGV